MNGMSPIHDRAMIKHIPPEIEREAILDASTACFMEFGYDGTSLEAIAARSGLPMSTVSQHFAGKAEIRSALYVLWSERLSAWISSA
jgi:TetR/AcrR family transcriptional repressor of mexJK operon